jgi:serine/threonine protein kinase/tetratricopeptide (TPR) repeat protein
MSEDRWRRIEELYHAALALPPDRRVAFVEQESGGDGQLRQEVESLLAQHVSNDSVFSRPVWTDLIDDESTSRARALLSSGAMLGPYRIIGLLGAGGMGQVYRAHDSRLERLVAIKVLLPEPDLRRIEKEARAIAALSHPNVVPIFDVGHDSGTDYLVEELVEGESLRDLLRGGPLSVVRFRYLAVQIAEGLAAAHRAGIIHRDLKPGNIMVTREDCARILDFGLATRHRTGPEEATISISRPGAVTGTPAYMSPEQIRGSTLDARSDIFSFGALMYEMITGQRAFARESISATLAAVLDATPPPIEEIAAGVPCELVHIVHKCLSKDPDGRYSSIDEVRIAINEFEKETTPAVGARRQWSKRFAAIGAGLTVIVIALAVRNWRFISYSGQALTGNDTIVLADFANSAGDSVFDNALKQGLAVQLGQSPLLNIVSEQRVRSALREMTRSPDETVTPEVAREVCERTGSKAYIAGSIANLGGHYVIGLNAVNCATGDALAREQIEAADKQHVIEALGSGAGALRNKLGESLGSIQKHDVPLAQATTSSLEALRAYSLGLSKYARGDAAGAVPQFQQAINLDADFAIAYANLGRAHQTLRQRDRMDEALHKAFELRNRTSEREKFDISSVYYQFITYQVDEAIQTCELWAQTYPLDFTPHRILGYEYAVVGKFDRSAEEFGKARDLDRSQALPYSGLILANMALNQLPQAHAAYQAADASKTGEPERGGYLLAFLEGDKAMMTQIAAALTSYGNEDKALLEESLTEAYFGHLRKAQELNKRAEALALSKGDKANAADIEARAAWLERLFGNFATAREHAAAALRLGGQPSMALSVAGDPVQSTVALALAADTVLAVNVASGLESHAPPGGFVSRVWLPEIRADLELRRGNPARALEFLEPVTRYEGGWFDNFLAAYLKGEAYLAEHRGREAAAEFQKIIDHRGVVLNSPIGALAHLGVARSKVLEGDTTKAHASYQDFLALWKDADSGIPILIAAKSEYARLKQPSP